MGKKEIEKIKREVRKFKEAITKKFGVNYIVIFGSAARGKMSKDSDVDIIVVSEKFGRKDVFNVVPKLYQVWHEKQKIDYPVDIILFNRREFDNLKRSVSIVREALREGIVV